MQCPTARNRRSARTTLIAAVVTGAILTGCGGVGGGGDGGGDDTAAKTAFCKQEKPDLTGKAAPKGDSKLSGTLTIWGWYNDVAKKAIVPEFQKLYPNVKFKFADFDLPDTHRKLALALNSGTGAPDISMVVDREGPRFWDLGLLDITSCMEPYQSLFTESKWSKVTRPGGQIQAVPWDGGSAVLFYPKSVFERLNIDPDSIRTWDDYISVGKRIKAATNGRVHMLLSNISENPNGTQNSLVRDFALLSQQNGGAWFDNEGKVVINNPKAVEALELLKRFRDEGITANDLGSAQAEFATLKNSTVATYPAPNWWSFYPKDQAPQTKGNWGVRLLPAFTAGGVPSSNFGGSSMAITNQTDAPEAAWAFLKFWLLRVEGRVDSYKVGSLEETVYAPAARDEFFKRPDPFFGKGYKQLVAKAGALAPPFAEGPQYPQIESEIQKRFPEFLQGGLSGEELLQQVADSVGTGA